MDNSSQINIKFKIKFCVCFDTITYSIKGQQLKSSADSVFP